MGTTKKVARLRRLTPVGVITAMLAVLLSFGAQAPAHAAGMHTVTAQLRLSTGAATEGYYEVLQKDAAPATTYSPYTEGYAPGGVVDVDLPDGVYKIGFYSFDVGDEMWFVTGGAAGTDESTATPIALTANRDLGAITFAVRTITAVVHDQLGHPVSGVSVRFADNPGDLENNWWDERTTDSQGRVVFRNQSTTSARYFQAFDDQGYRAAYDPSDVMQDGVGTTPVALNLTMQKLATVTGHVVKAGSNTPLSMIQVRVLDETGKRFGTVATTLSDGSYTVTGLPAGRYTVEFSDPLGDYDTQYWLGQTSFDTANFGNVAAYAQLPNINGFLSPTAKPTPTGVDLAGLVSGRGKPLENVLVTAYRNGVAKGSQVTGRDGSYSFTDLTSGTYKVSYDRLSGPADELPFTSQWYLGSHSSGAATPITVTEDASGPTRNVTLDSYGVITGSVLDAANNPVAYPEVFALDSDESDGYGGYDGSSSPGAYRLEVPPGSYHVHYDGWDDADFTEFIPEWWDNSPTLQDADAITVAPNGTVTANVHLSKNLETLSAPTITGTGKVGSPLTGSPGKWNLTVDNDYQYAWFRGATQVGSSSTYTPTAADAGSKLTLRVTAWHGSLTGTAFSAPTVAIKFGSAGTLTGRSPKTHVVKLYVGVSVSGVPNPGGTLTIMRGSKVVKTGVAVVNGQAAVKLTKQKSGKRSYTAVYGGTSKVDPSTSNTVTVKVK